jgi:coenzyme F420-reducing hydrogenase alpha subunit|tara:strand:+ start:126 stop:494 length:369 start_codon:yes stop_codon:yes gene_type:complete
MSLDKEIFKGKTLSDLFGEIYDNSKETKSQVKGLIAELKPLIENIGDATLLVPMIKEYMEIGVKNDEHLIKLATVIQRLEIAASRGETGEFDFSELQDLLEESQETQEEVKDVEKPQDEEEL